MLLLIIDFSTFFTKETPESSGADLHQITGKFQTESVPASYQIFFAGFKRIFADFS
jgi:hypothetical protein